MDLHYLENQFDNATKGSTKKMLIVTNDHVPRLQAQQADPDIAALLARTLGPHDSFLQAYSDHKSAQAFYKGATLGIDILLTDLSGKQARQWDSNVMIQFDKGTSEHMSLFPNGRTPFQQGTMDERIAAVNTLAKKLADYPSLATLQTTVSDFHTLLKDTRDAQQNREQLTEQASTDLENARLAIAIMLYRNMGSLMDKFGETPEQIANYFEIALIQRHGSTSTPDLTGVVAAGGTVNIAELTTAVSSIILTNTGSVPLTFCLAATATDACATGIIVEPGKTRIAIPSDFGAVGNALLNVTNNDPATEGSYSVESA